MMAREHKKRDRIDRRKENATTGFPTREEVARVRGEYPIGCEVELIYMDDVSAPPAGTRGKVIYIDDCATIHVSWITGCSLGIVYGVDICRKVQNTRGEEK